MHKHYLIAIGTLTALGIAQPASAQVEDIVAIARKREESLQKVPVAVSAFSGAQLESQGVRDFSKLGLITPSLAPDQRTQGSPSAVNFNLRGQRGADVLITIDPAVGTYIDGAPVTHGYGLGGAFYDIERIEVLKGPQGTLYGKNTTGGAINVITRKPDYEGYHGYAQIDVGNYTNVDYGGAINLPIVDDMLAVRLSFQRNSRNGYVKQSGATFDINGAAPGSVTAGTQDLGDEDSWAFRGGLLFDPSDKVSVNVTGEYLRIRENGQAMKTVGWLLPATIAPTTAEGRIQAASELFGVAGAATTVPQRDAADAFVRNVIAGRLSPFVSDSGSLLTHGNYTGYNLVGNVSFELDENTQLKSITGYRTFHEDRNTEIDGLLFVIHDSPQDAKGTAFSQEFNVSGQAMDDRLDWIGGVFYNTEQGLDQSASLARPANNSRALARIIGDVRNSSWAVFSQLNYAITDRLKLTGGGRYTEETRDLTSRTHSQFTVWNPIAKTVTTGGGTSMCLTQPFPPFVFVPFGDDGRACQRILPSLTAQGWSWLGSLDYQVTDDVLLYVKTARGFRSGGYNLRGIGSATFDPTRPEIARDVEVGMKGDFFDNRLRANIALYKTKYSDKIESFLLLTGGVLQTVIQNAAQSGVKGAELELTATPWEGMTLMGTGTYLDAAYKQFLANDTNAGGLGVSGVVNRAGQPFLLATGVGSTRKWSYSVSARQEFDLGAVTIAPQADWSWRSGLFLDPVGIYAIAILAGQSEFVGIAKELTQSYGLLNLRLDVNVPEFGVNVGLYATNVLDKVYYTAGTNVAGRQYVNALVNEPRFYGIQIKKTFGND